MSCCPTCCSSRDLTKTAEQSGASALPRGVSLAVEKEAIALDQQTFEPVVLEYEEVAINA